MADNIKCERCGYEPWDNQRTWTIRLDLTAVSQNQLGGYGRGRSGWKYRSVKRAYDRAVAEALQLRRVPCATKFRRLVVCRRFAKKRRPFDEGNLVGGFKPLVDALSAKGIIVDDAPRFVKVWYRQQPSDDGKDHVEITVEEQIVD